MVVAFDGADPAPFIRVRAGPVPQLERSACRSPVRCDVLIFAATNSAEVQVLEVERSLVARTFQQAVPAGAAAEPPKPSVSSQPVLQFGGRYPQAGSSHGNQIP